MSPRKCNACEALIWLFEVAYKPWIFVGVFVLTLDLHGVTICLGQVEQESAETRVQLDVVEPKKNVWPESTLAALPEYPPPVLSYSAQFSAETRDKFDTTGEVRFDTGVVTLAAGGQLSLPVKAGPWFSTKLDLQFGELAPGDRSELQISFALPGTVDQAVISFKQRRDALGSCKSRISIYNWNPILQTVRSFDIDGPIPDGKWLIEYRYLAISIQHDVFKEHLYRAFADVTFDAKVSLVDVQYIAISNIEKTSRVLAWELEVYHPPFELSRQNKGKLRETNAAALHAIGMLTNQRFLSLTQRLEEVTGSERNAIRETQTTHEQVAEMEGVFRRDLEIKGEILGFEHPGYADTVGNLAVLYHCIGDYPRAEPLYQEALHIQGKALGREHPIFASSLQNLAQLYCSMGDYTRAEPLYQNALQIREKVLGTEQTEYASSLYSLAALYASMGDKTRAEPLVRQAMTIYGKAVGKDHPDYADCLQILAWLYNDIGEKARAEPLLREAMTIYGKTGWKEHPDYADMLSHLAVLYVSMGDYVRAEPLVRESMAIMEKVLGKEHPDYAKSLNYLAVLYLSMGDAARAESMYREALDISLLHLEKTAAIQSESQQLQMAMTIESCLINYLTSIGESKSSVDDVLVRALQWKGAIFARQRLMRLARETDDPVIKATLGQLQAVASQLATLSLTVQHEPAKLDEWRQKLVDLDSERNRLERELSAASAEYRAIRQQAKIQTADVLNVIPADAVLVDIYRYLRKSETVNKYGVPTYESAYCAFVIRPGGSPKLVELGSKSEIDGQIERWRRGFGRSLDGDLDPGLALRKLLWEPLTAELEGVTTVLLSPEGATGTLPWAALPGSKPESYLLEEYVFVTIPVPQLLPELLRQEVHVKSGLPSMLMVGDVDYGATSEQSQQVALSRPAAIDRSGGLRKWEPLNDTRSEIVTIRDSFERFFPAGEVKILREGSATEGAFRELSPQHRFLHLATHGFFAGPSLKSVLSSTDNPEMLMQGVAKRNQPARYHPGVLSGLVMAGANNEPQSNMDDGILTALELCELDLRAVECAVLSACRTGLGSVAGGEGLLGLQRAFQIAGTRTTVASLWDVDSAVTRELMTRFYENLYHPDPTKRAPSRIEALRRAQLELLSKPDLMRGGEDELAGSDQPKRLPPKYWAAWVLSGDWR